MTGLSQLPFRMANYFKEVKTFSFSFSFSFTAANNRNKPTLVFEIVPACFLKIYLI
jgi:hypothetical protein